MTAASEQIVAALRTAFHLLDEHTPAEERQAIYEAVANHVRSAAPMALGGAWKEEEEQA